MSDAILTCPRCGSEMEERTFGAGRVNVCPTGDGVFLDRADLGRLVEAENDWHDNASARTMPMPRITPDMVAPPARKMKARAWVETLFG